MEDPKSGWGGASGSSIYPLDSSHANAVALFGRAFKGKGLPRTMRGWIEGVCGIEAFGVKRSEEVSKEDGVWGWGRGV